MKQSHNGFRTQYEHADYKQAGYNWAALKARQAEAIKENENEAKPDVKETVLRPAAAGLGQVQAPVLRQPAAAGPQVQAVPSLPGIVHEVKEQVAATRCGHGYLATRPGYSDWCPQCKGEQP